MGDEDCVVCVPNIHVRGDDLADLLTVAMLNLRPITVHVP